MNNLITISADTFQEAWAKAVIELKNNKWEIWNLVVQIKSPLLIDQVFHNSMNNFAKSHDLKTQERVAYTIFPYKLYRPGVTREKLYKKYRRYFNMNKLHKYSKWKGTYFERMICYKGNNQEVDQLGSIIDSINTRKVNYGASYVMVIPYPYKDIKRTMGAPCLNYLTIQVDDTSEKRFINLCAVYRNHDFRGRAYGNYMGLGKLINYIASETHSEVGTLTCLSSKAYVNKNTRELANLAEDFLKNGKIHFK